MELHRVYFRTRTKAWSSHQGSTLEFAYFSSD
jgi:hypothetical protein